MTSVQDFTFPFPDKLVALVLLNVPQMVDEIHFLHHVKLARLVSIFFKLVNHNVLSIGFDAGVLHGVARDLGFDTAVPDMLSGTP